MFSFGFSEQEIESYVAKRKRKFPRDVKNAFLNPTQNNNLDPAIFFNRELNNVRAVICALLAGAEKLRKNGGTQQLLQTSSYLCAETKDKGDDDIVFDHPDVVDAYERYLEAGGEMVIFIKFQAKPSKLLTFLSDNVNKYKKQFAIYEFFADSALEKDKILQSWKADSMVYGNFVRLEKQQQPHNTKAEDESFEAYVSPNDPEAARKLQKHFANLCKFEPKKRLGDLSISDLTPTLEEAM